MEAVDLISRARHYLYVRETGTNEGPEVNKFLAFVGCKPGCSWCAGFVSYIIHETDPTVVFHKSASALSLLEKNPDLVTDDPQPGDIVVFLHNVTKHLGHVGVLTEVVRINGEVAGIDVIAGNTSADGTSRNGDRVAEHPCSLDKVQGYLRVCTA